MSSNLLSLAGWYFLPNLVTSYLQTALYSIFIRAGDHKPHPGSARFARDRKRLLIFVILAYLCYTVYEADYQLQRQGDFYRDLAVSHTASERDIQSRFRRLTVQFHPDKVSGGEREKVEAIYVHLKLARDTLIDPVKRFAYDRFGPEVLQWRQCKTIRDFVFHGAQMTAAYYAVSGAVLVLLGLLGYLQQGRFWRYLVMFSLFIIELHTMTRPDFPAFLANVANSLLIATGLRPPYLPFQMIILLRKLVVTFFIALSQLGPVLKDPNMTLTESGDVVPTQLIERVNVLATATGQEVSRLMGLELMPFVENEVSSMDGVRRSLKEWLVQNTFRNDPEVKRAVSAVLDRRRKQAHAETEANRILPS
ncbi:hypothetical protein M433DRAFT_74234 [Acidomyces richmondensis BFW]|nr:MAG: hypothetical protein FE78DRAFT_139307 [Acidomyces sp. 'richmondensis']KYG42239.1 hypothetical protein M433DRAFT_74234 [Acidomyces richmondensis BFW]